MCFEQLKASKSKTMIEILYGIAVAAQTIFNFAECLRHSVTCSLRKRNTAVFYEVMFFPDKGLMCKHFLSTSGCRHKNCPFVHEQTSLNKLIKWISEAKSSLDLCIYTISCQDLANAVLQLHQNGIHVRVITDDEQMGSKGSQIQKFFKEGIRVRHDKSSYFMHHKFFIIDSKILVNGSFNWTRQAVTGNRENVLVTNNPVILQPYRGEFERLWNMYNPCRDPITSS